jgi:DNA mismatch repair ATPase MutS
LALKWTPQLGHFCHVRGKDVRAEIPDARNVSSSKSTRAFQLPDWSHLGSRLEDAKSRIRAEEQRVLNDLRKRVSLKMTGLSFEPVDEKPGDRELGQVEA